MIRTITRMKNRLMKCGLPLIGSVFLGALVWIAAGAATARRTVRAADTPPLHKSDPEIEALRSEVNRLKGMVPDQSHVMKDVAYHFANLWFAGQKANWPLADFYWSETRSHLRWAVRIIPVRKDAQGNDVVLKEILDPIEKGSLEEVHKAITEKNSSHFAEAYKQMLGSCYACHLAAAKPFLKLRIPDQPEVPIIDFQP